jgi:hypothetical protein
MAETQPRVAASFAIRRSPARSAGVTSDEVGADDRAAEPRPCRDELAFRTLIDPFPREFELHCYRILGSLQDAEDTLQESLLVIGGRGIRPSCVTTRNTKGEQQ